MTIEHQTSKQPPWKAAEIEARRQRVATMRLAHLSQREIAEQLGVSLGTVNQDLRAIRDEWLERRVSAYDEWVAEELAKLDRIEKIFFPKILAGDLGATDRVFSAMDRRARLLGLDKPQEHRHTVITQDMIHAEIERLEAEIEKRALEEAGGA